MQTELGKWYRVRLSLSQGGSKFIGSILDQLVGAEDIAVEDYGADKPSWITYTFTPHKGDVLNPGDTFGEMIISSIQEVAAPVRTAVGATKKKAGVGGFLVGVGALILGAALIIRKKTQ